MEKMQHWTTVTHYTFFCILITASSQPTWTPRWAFIHGWCEWRPNCAMLRFIGYAEDWLAGTLPQAGALGGSLAVHRRCCHGQCTDGDE